MNKGVPLNHIYLGYLAAVLLGYLALDKGFAYAGVNPIFIGEITLGLGFLIVLTGGFSTRVFKSPIVWVLIAFMMWHALRTLPFIDVYGLSALRDGVLWGYALFAILVAGLLLKADKVEAVPNIYARLRLPILLGGLIAFLVTEIVGEALPLWPGTDATLVLVKAADLGVQVAGVLAFMALGLHTVFPRKRMLNVPLIDLMIWGLCAIGTIVVLSRARGGFVAIVAAMALVTLFRPGNRFVKMLAPASAIVILFVALDVNVPLGGGRTISPQDTMTNLLSIVTEQDEDRLDTTETWRLNWWESIITDVWSNRFWLGRGYGVSHAEIDGFADDAGNRSPHNVTINFLGRGGFPGAALWLLLLATSYWMLFSAYRRARSAGNQPLANLNLWIMAWLLAYLVVGSLEVYIEGPQGGIPFWCVIGFAIALTEAQRAPAAAPRPARVSGREDASSGEKRRGGLAGKPARRPQVAHAVRRLAGV